VEAARRERERVKALAVALAGFALVCCRASAAPTALPDFEHVVLVVLENKESTDIVGSHSAPAFNLYGRVYARIANYYAVTHPSLPNYLALVGGSTFGITTNCVDCDVDAASLADSIEASDRTWKAYIEGLPRRGFAGGAAGRYAKKHNPFAYFRRIMGDPTRANRIVPSGELAGDLATKRLPDFALVVPDLCNSTHDCPVATGDAWTRRTVGPLLGLPRTVVFITYDEGATDRRGGGHVATVAAGTAVRRHAVFRPVTGHYGLLRTIEQAWDLPYLGRSARTRPITGIWR
jgi:hypothetical protein